MKKYMIVENFKPDCSSKVYQRHIDKGRMLPDGLYYLHSWLNEDKNVCFQLMETNDEELIAIWTDKWKDLIDFEVYPII
ncbi:DUF3303 domain-containing protein [Muricauda sp. JGD-17]|uniref:DUF3303 domain-containing protein n=1 Tax=Flagellimonas ochracea TaxID=2696472 RepID=A0A964WYX6_9FLAO|nr:DUF3303 family protein [Allomuricauda ochracea]NAY93323.1 DUF3303 domain-containing protein [Allomuricauda ochracea]